MSTNTVTLECAACKKTFQREARYVRRANRLGRPKFYCSQKCSGPANGALRTKARKTQAQPQEVAPVSQDALRVFTAPTSTRSRLAIVFFRFLRGLVAFFSRRRPKEVPKEVPPPVEDDDFIVFTEEDFLAALDEYAPTTDYSADEIPARAGANLGPVRTAPEEPQEVPPSARRRGPVPGPRVTVACVRCGKSVQRRASVVLSAAAKGRRTFCGNACALAAARPPVRHSTFTRACAWCGKAFTSSTHKQNVTKRFCDARCARQTKENQARMRRGRQTVIRNNAVRVRAAVEAALLEGERPIQVRYRLGRHVFDLAFLDTKVLVDFVPVDDAPVSKRAMNQRRRRAARKEAVAQAAGFTLERRALPAESPP